MSQTQLDLLSQRVDRLERIVKEAVLALLDDAFGDLPDTLAPFAAADGVDPAEVARMRTRYDRLVQIARNRARLKAL